MSHNVLWSVIWPVTSSTESSTSQVKCLNKPGQNNCSFKLNCSHNSVLASSKYFVIILWAFQWRHHFQSSKTVLQKVWPARETGRGSNAADWKLPGHFDFSFLNVCLRLPELIKMFTFCNLFLYVMSSGTGLQVQLCS